MWELVFPHQFPEGKDNLEVLIFVGKTLEMYV